MTESEIVKALECCEDESLSQCENCPYHHAGCIDRLLRDARVLINRQQAEIERLTKQQKTYIMPARGGIKTEYLMRKIKFLEEKAIECFSDLLVSKAKSTKERFVLESLVESVMKEMGCGDESKA